MYTRTFLIERWNGTSALFRVYEDELKVVKYQEKWVVVMHKNFEYYKIKAYPSESYANIAMQLLNNAIYLTKKNDAKPISIFNVRALHKELHTIRSNK